MEPRTHSVQETARVLKVRTFGQPSNDFKPWTIVINFLIDASLEVYDTITSLHFKQLLKTNSRFREMTTS